VVVLLFAFTLPSVARAEDTAVQITPDISYLAPERAEKLDLYLPASRPPEQLSPAVVWIHGGGWSGGIKSEARAKEICTTLASNGYVAVSIDYLLGPGAWPQNLLDCKNAVRFLRAHAAEYRVDPNRIAVAGGSAGGHLALMVGFTAGKKELEPEDLYPGVSSAVRCIIDMYGPANLRTRRQTDAHGNPTATRKLMGNSLAVFGASSEATDVLRLASPVTHVTKASPPVLIFHGRADSTVDYPQSEELARTLQQHRVPHELVLLDDVGHTFDWETWRKKPLPRDLRPVALSFLAQNMK
jgi:acetyl esterase/lipase